MAEADGEDAFLGALRRSWEEVWAVADQTERETLLRLLADDGDFVDVRADLADLVLDLVDRLGRDHPVIAALRGTVMLVQGVSTTLPSDMARLRSVVLRKPTPAPLEDDLAAEVIEALASLESGSPEVAQFRNMVDMARSMLPSVPPGSAIHAQLRLIVGFNTGLDALSAGRWTADHEAALSSIPNDAASTGSELPQGLAEMIPVLIVMMRTARTHSLMQSADEPNHPGPAELTDLTADLESMADRVGKIMIPGAKDLQRVLRLMAAYFLILPGGQDDSRLIDRAQTYLKDPPPESAVQAWLLLGVSKDVRAGGTQRLDKKVLRDFTKYLDPVPDRATVGLLRVAMSSAAGIQLSFDDLADPVYEIRPMPSVPEEDTFETIGFAEPPADPTPILTDPTPLKSSDLRSRVRAVIREIPHIDPAELLETDNSHLLLLPADERATARLPSFQFDKAGRPHGVVIAVNELLDAANDPWGVACWWIFPHARLGAAPINMIDVDDDLLIRSAHAILED